MKLSQTITAAVLGIVATTVILAVAAPAYAACDPKCKLPEVCRYNNGNYYCAKPTKKGVKTGGFSGGTLSSPTVQKPGGTR